MLRSGWDGLKTVPYAEGRATMPYRYAGSIEVVLFVLFALSAPGASNALAQLPNPYGPSITLENAKKIAASAIAEARRNNWNMAVAVVDISGDLVYFEKMDGTQAASVDIAPAKARSAARFKRPTKALQDVLAAGGEGLRLLALEGAVPVEGGLPIVMDDKIVGAIGVSGGTSQQDGQSAKAGTDALAQRRTP